MLDTVAQLAQHLVRDVQRVLRDKINAHALRADQPYHQFDLFQ